MFNLDDPKNLALIMAGLQMMQHDPRQRSNFGNDVSRGLLGGLQGYQQGKGLLAQNAEREERSQERQMRLDAMRQQQEAMAQRQQALTGLGQQRPDLAPLLQLAPDKAIDRAFPAPQQPRMTFAPNGQVVDMNSLQPGANFAKQPDWKDPEYQAFQLKRAATSAPQVNVNTKQETEFGKALGKQQGEDYAALMKSDASASSQLNKLSRLESLLASSGKTGKLTPATMELKSVAESLGFKVDPRLPFQQAAQALSSEIALGLRNPAGGAGMPGALSDKDREFLQNMVPNLAKTPEGNKMLLETAKKLAQREKEVAKLARQYRQQTGRFDEGFYEVLGQFSAKNPLFAAPEASTITPQERAELEDLRKRFGRPPQ